MKYYAAVKKNEDGFHRLTWSDFQGIFIEKSKLQQSMYGMPLFVLQERKKGK